MPGVVSLWGRFNLASMLTMSNMFAAELIEVRLSKTPFTVSPAGVEDFTEATFGGYTAKQENPGYAYPPVLDGTDYLVNFGTHTPFTWTCLTDPETIYGWAIYDVESGELFAAEVYDEPHELEVGSVHTLYASIKIGQCY